jgi:hypothetical protein
MTDVFSSSRKMAPLSYGDERDALIRPNQIFAISLTNSIVSEARAKSILRDLSCGLAGESTFTSNLGSFTGPVIMFAAGHGFGTAMLDTAQLMTSASVSVNFKEEYGHVDYVFSTNHLHELEHPILNWLLQEPFN